MLWPPEQMAEAHDLADRVRAREVWLASPEGRKAQEPFDEIARREAGNAKLRRKIEKMQGRAR